MRLQPNDLRRVEHFFELHRDTKALHLTISIDTLRAIERVLLALSSLPPVQTKKEAANV